MPLLPSSADANARRLLAAKALRAIADGYVSILLPAYLLRLGLSPLQVGAIATATLLGSAAATMLAGSITARLGHRRALLAASALMSLTGFGFAGLRAFWPLLLIAFIGTLNPSSGDVSIFLPLEQSLISQSALDRDRTALFARHNIVAAVMGALGTVLAGAPDWVAVQFRIPALGAMQAMFVAYALLGLSAGTLYSRLIEPRSAERGSRDRPLGPSSRPIVCRLAALFCVDAFGGGLIVQTILALWLLKRFHFSLATISALFFCSNLLIACSYLAASAIASRIGLVRTMVFTHLPSNVCVLAIPFTSKPPLAIALILVRSLLSQMDVPTRSSYVMAIVTPPERPAAAITSVPRSLAAAVSPTLAGYLLTVTSFAWPLLFAGALKIIYDLTLLAMFRHVRPPEEISSLPPGGGCESIRVRDCSIREK